MIHFCQWLYGDKSGYEFDFEAIRPQKNMIFAIWANQQICLPDGHFLPASNWKLFGAFPYRRTYLNGHTYTGFRVFFSTKAKLTVFKWNSYLPVSLVLCAASFSLMVTWKISAISKQYTASNFVKCWVCWVHGEPNRRSMNTYGLQPVRNTDSPQTP